MSVILCSILSTSTVKSCDSHSKTWSESVSNRVSRFSLSFHKLFLQFIFTCNLKFQLPFTKIMLKTVITTVNTPLNHLHWCNLHVQSSKMKKKTCLQYLYIREYNVQATLFISL